MANNFVNGKLGTITLAGTQFATMKYSFKETLSDVTDITYTQAGGATFAVKQPGYNMCAGTLTFVYDTLNQPVIAPNLIPGQTIAMVLYPEGTKPYAITALLTEQGWDTGPQVKGPVVVTVPWESTGPYTRPTS